MSEYRNDIEKYLKGELTPAERHALEKAALDDPFLADALEGAEQLSSVHFSSDVAELNQKIQEKKRTSPWVLRIAASIVLVMVSGFLVWLFLQQENEQQLALDKNPNKNESQTEQFSLTDTVPTQIEVQQPAIPESKPEITRTPASSKAQSGNSKSAAPQKNSSAAETKPAPQVLATEKTEPVKAEEAELVIQPAEVVPAEGRIADKVSTPKPVSSPDAKRVFADELESKKKEALARDDQRSYLQSTQGAAAPSGNTNTNVIEGYVTSAEDGSPLPGVSVVIKGSSIGTQTDANGFYHIEAPVTNAILQYAFIGMRTTEVTVDKTKQVNKEVNIKLQEDMATLSEVVVTGYGSNRSTESISVSIVAAHPVNGTREFKKYLETSVRYPEEALTKKIQGRVIVEFTVNYDSTLSDFTIIRGIGGGCDEELIRLIKEGPKWVPTKSNNFFVNDKVRVRFKFELPR